MHFGQAIEHLKNGGKVAREGWNGKGMFLALQRPSAGSEMGEPYIYLKTVKGSLVPWNPNNLDMLADDWVVVGA